MPTTQTFWCTDCKSYKQAYNNEPNRCWGCDKYTLIRNDVTIRQTPGQSLSTTTSQRAQLAGEMANWVRASGNQYEYTASIEVTKDSANYSLTCKPFVPPKQ